MPAEFGSLVVFPDLLRKIFALQTSLLTIDTESRNVVPKMLYKRFSEMLIRNDLTPLLRYAYNLISKLNLLLFFVSPVLQEHGKEGGILMQDSRSITTS